MNEEGSEFKKRFEEYCSKDSELMLSRIHNSAMKIINLFTPYIQNKNEIAKEIISKTFESILLGNRTWDPKRNFEENLFQQLLSNYGNYVKEMKNNKFIKVKPNSEHSAILEMLIESKGGDILIPRFDELMDEIYYDTMSTSKHNLESFIDQNILKEKLNKLLARDEMSIKVIDCIFQNIVTNKEIANYLNVKTTEVENAKNRISRKIQKSKLFSENLKIGVKNKNHKNGKIEQLEKIT